MSLQNRRLKTSAGSSSIIVLLCKHRTHNLINFYKEFKCVPLRKDIPTLTLTQGFYLLWLSSTPLEALRFKHSPQQFHTPWGKSKMSENLLCSFPLSLFCKHAIKQNTHKADTPCKTRQISKTEQWNRLSLKFKGDFRQLTLLSLWVCQCSTSPYNRAKGAPVTNRQSCWNILGLQLIHWHSRHGSGSINLAKTE